MSGIVVLISGRGSNLAAMCRAGLAPQIKCVISNKADVRGLAIAKQYDIRTHVIDHTKFESRKDFDIELAKTIDGLNPSLIALAGFMRILTPEFVRHYASRIINIHPSLLPSFTGAEAQSSAVGSHVKVSGATVHYVTAEVDHGPIIAQGVVPVKGDDSIEDLSTRILALEHVIYPFAIKKILAKQVHHQQSEVVIVDTDEGDEDLLGDYFGYVYY